MAVNNRKWFCYACDKSFEYKSKYTRHLTTATHKRLMTIMDDETNTEETFQDEFTDTDLNYSSKESEIDDVAASGCEVEEQNSIDSSAESPTEKASLFQLSDESDMYDLANDDYSSVFEDLMESSTEADDFTPFISKGHALTFMILHAPRPIGERNLKFILFILKQYDSTIQRLDALKKFKLPGFIDPVESVVNGIRLFTILPSTILEQCFSTQNIAEQLVRYPEIPKHNLSQLYHAECWHQNFPSIMTIHNETNIFINDFLLFQHDHLKETIGKVVKIFTKEDEKIVYLEIQLVLSIDQLWKLEPQLSLLNVDRNLFVIYGHLDIPVLSAIRLISPPEKICKYHNYRLHAISYQEYFQFTSSHPLKGNLPVFVVPLVLFSDDTSGNKSKKWNKFDYWSLTLAGLPIKESRMFKNIFFLSCSNRLSAIEIAEPLVDDLKALESGRTMYDVSLNREVLVIAKVMMILADNARASELLNHLGSRANKFCRICMSDSKEPTVIAELRSKDLAIRQIRQISMEVTESGRKSKRTEFGMKEEVNPLLKLSVDLYKSTPVEVLHTILLGSCKYMLRSFMKNRSKVEKQEILARVAAFPYCGFSVRITGNIAYHYQSFIGRDFKAWIQMCLFIIPTYVSNDEKRCWFSLAQLFRSVYCLPLNEETMRICKKACTDFVESTTQYMPEYSRRLKVHILLHLPDNLKEFGPAHLYSTERFESFNSLLRDQNIHSNRHSPSQDIARGFATIQHLRYICSGSSVGKGLQELYNTDQVQMFLNCLPSRYVHSCKPMSQPGYLRKFKHGTKIVAFKDVSCHTCFEENVVSFYQYSDHYNYNLYLPSSWSLNVLVYTYGAVVSKDSNLVNVGDFVEVTDFRQVCYGILITVVQAGPSQETQGTLCIIRELKLKKNADGKILTNDFDCPLLSLTSDIYAVSPSNIAKPISIVHSCSNTCQVTNSVFKHNFTNHLFCLNIFCTGNYEQ